MAPATVLQRLGLTALLALCAASMAQAVQAQAAKPAASKKAAPALNAAPKATAQLAAPAPVTTPVPTFSAAPPAAESPPSASDALTPVNPWPAIAQADIDFLYRTLRDNHPGAIDGDNPYFKQWLERGFAEASVRASAARTLADAMAALSFYVAGFADGHLGLGFTYQPKTVEWPEMIIARQANKYIVKLRDESGGNAVVPVGAQVLTCDGRAIGKILNDDILPAKFNNPKSESTRIRFAPYLFVIEAGNPRPKLKSCIFVYDGGQHEVALTWSRITQGYLFKQLATAIPKSAGVFSVKEVQPKKFWVSLPTFAPEAGEENDLKKIIDNMPALRDADLIVFDVRGNAGGNSQWSADILTGLFGKKFMDEYDATFPDLSYAVWRVSPGNHAMLANTVVPQNARQFGEKSPSATQFASLEKRMQQAMLERQPFVKQRDGAPPAMQFTPRAQLPSATSARVVFLTDAGCASACLDFADTILGLPNVVHMGQTTGADTVYMDVRAVDFPSGLGSFSFAQKVYRERKRAHNQDYVPAYRFDGDIGDTDQVQRWVLTHSATRRAVK